MKRRRFNQVTCYGGSLALVPSLKMVEDSIAEEIIGKKEPPLFGEGYRLRKKAADAFKTMTIEAKASGFDIVSVSSYRSFNDQKRIWNNKYTRFTGQGSTPGKAIERIIEYSTIPGTSRHHWGTDIDIVDGNKEVEGDRLLPNLFQPGKPYGKFKKWLNENAQKFGFHEVYTDRPGRKGFKYEPWHFSYAPLSTGYLKTYMKIDFQELLRGLDIQGSDKFEDDFIDRYWKHNMLDINPQLKV